MPTSSTGGTMEQLPLSIISTTRDGVSVDGVRWQSPVLDTRNGGAGMATSRVCDRCIRKKIKCDQQRPTCSRCFEQGFTCSYSSTRRKPGPARGYRRDTQTARKTARRSSQASQHDSSTNPPTPQQSELSAVTSTTTTGRLDHPGPSESGPSESPQATFNGTNDLAPFDIQPHEEGDLLQEYLNTINVAIPLFDKHDFLSNCQSGHHGRDLILTIVIITAKVTGYIFSSANTTYDIDAHLDRIMRVSSLEEDMLCDTPSIDQFRKACLLAFYEFHQFPGQQAWMRICKLSRTALWIGLDRLEDLTTRHVDWGVLTEQKVEEWRLVWWCVYQLDSYANLSSGTSYIIEEGLVNTALMQGCDWSSADNNVSTSTRQMIFLPSPQKGLWESIPAIAVGSSWASYLNLHIITVTALRRVGRALKSYMLRPLENAASLIDVDRKLSALRLALPTNYLNICRNAFASETGAEHHARLVTVFHLYMAKLLLSIMFCSQHSEGEQWLLCWQQVLEACQDIASISEQWNSSHTSQVDPAISFIIFTALIFLEIHKKSESTLLSNPHAAIQHYETVLLLHLEQFATIWTVPRLLILSLKGFRETVSGPLAYRHIQYILSRFEAPLHPRWLQFLSTAQVELEAC